MRDSKNGARPRFASTLARGLTRHPAACLRQGVWILLALGISFGSIEAASADGKDRLNILLLLADDLGYGELGCYGQETIRTPNIDRLAGEGMRFTQFYAGSSLCAPSRAVLMTGKQVGRLNIRGNYGVVGDQVWGRVALKKSNWTVAEMLRGAGYQTAFIGKWHLGVPQDVSTWAAGRGFDYAVQEQWGGKAGGPIELYNLKSDLAENRNVAGAHPERVEKIRALMEAGSQPVSFFPHAGGADEDSSGADTADE